jgi:O-acetylhomoserine/O-acetylserine sulfhydrylase-like pyridoxal-dependent enzyme
MSDKMRRVLIQLPPTVHEQIKQDAARLRISVPGLIRIALGRLDVDELASDFAKTLTGED